jgi:hypothetical protein
MDNTIGIGIIEQAITLPSYELVLVEAVHEGGSTHEDPNKGFTYSGPASISLHMTDSENHYQMFGINNVQFSSGSAAINWASFTSRGAAGGDPGYSSNTAFRGI